METKRQTTDRQRLWAHNSDGNTHAATDAEVRAWVKEAFGSLSGEAACDEPHEQEVTHSLRVQLALQHLELRVAEARRTLGDAELARRAAEAQAQARMHAAWCKLQEYRAERADRKAWRKARQQAR